MDPPPPPPRHWAPPPRRDGNHAQFVDSFETSTEVQLVLELLSGGTLLGLLERQGKLPEAHARKVVCEIASGLEVNALLAIEREMDEDGTIRERFHLVAHDSSGDHARVWDVSEDE